MILTFSEFRELELQEKLTHCFKLFEKYLIEEQVNLKDWGGVFKILNEINSFKYIDEWFYKFCEILPDSILEEPFFEAKKDDWEYLTRKDFETLRYIYLNTKQLDKINNLMNLINEMAGIELYTDSKAISKISFEPYSSFIDLIKK